MTEDEKRSLQRALQALRGAVPDDQVPNKMLKETIVLIEKKLSEKQNSSC
ncbi:hypothetical protein UFOVP1361_47 [uncultured Caudovirales phage]|uniref:Uncharacterized protein n=1 Tax=uncultured Caudovirales phage TaxID=2100421 RepID=A0A6J5RUL4_9CAUD|nr:hypothetical protein UFOVP1361_47 [uncultured Caudovirales phage]